MKVMFDVDGVLADFGLGFRRLLKDLFQLRELPPEAQTWDDFVHGKGLGLTKADLDMAWRRIERSHDFWANLPALASRQEMREVDQLRARDGHDVYFVTSRPGRHVKAQTEMWLMLQGIWAPTVIVSKWKGDAARLVQADFSLEDKAENAWAVAWLSPQTRSFLIDRPYNQYDAEKIGASAVERVYSVSEYLAHIRAQVEAPHQAA